MTARERFGAYGLPAGSAEKCLEAYLAFWEAHPGLPVQLPFLVARDAPPAGKGAFHGASIAFWQIGEKVNGRLRELRDQERLLGACRQAARLLGLKASSPTEKLSRPGDGVGFYLGKNAWEFEVDSSNFPAFLRLALCALEVGEGSVGAPP